MQSTRVHGGENVLFDHLNINDVRGICGCSSKPKVVRRGPTTDLGISIRCEELCPVGSGR